MSKRFVILGGGESGVGAALLAKKKGYDVFLSDESSLKDGYRNELLNAGIDFEEGKHSVEKILNADEVMKSPGIPEKAAMVKKIRSAGIAVVSEIEFAFRFKGDSKIIAITGSNGKTTTTALTFHLCSTAGLDAAMVGNIGASFARQVAVHPKDLYVVEVSSFQLDDIKHFKPDVAILTNITEDHLDRYDYQFENYIRSKFRIVMNQQQDDFFIFCADDEITMKYLNKENFFGFNIQSKQLPISMKRELPNGAFIKDGDMYVRTGQEFTRMSVFDFALKGKHNQYNTMAACVAATTLDIRKEKIREAVQTFQNFEHRMEHVATVRGVEFINDSKATNVNSVWYALESMTKPTILILGGVDKGNDYSLIEELVKEKVKAIICLGTDNKKIHEAFGKVAETIVDAGTANEAVHIAFHFATKGDVVLLSPACASFDLFKNYEDRGQQFKKAVKEL
ncbi:MAG TPA: UDP-N-acetylmuramoyl-L-alanine--D-glutamate ligase [Chitinophagaceae bacterium]|jgi:UDP-N-acetylmuramoylalanine--D-glutamate ligase|nr:UDP-N-acetylmuramoyl-L-alanine--D-glutamate ligase [Chitinophagaceae bacterium]OPZ19478.1 MAG: UDP-N-acetylmuramoylalanine--D-glutamate ligase [Bacteroidetes bacterium ADurb.BinA245]HMW65395.1 UDP-N-acetylmuramoyl-L-alanine--D-glutamate ligase [Chitinophagaceae bacterium]HMX76987.1 UDP-N-acetylmuramoyl-L-alanine--D-glutamate ligase [Chitinophagaceae bacterium]HNA18442.1 UDP-N-acetylmuramoyl-L-alanine--D-glutamate ligase [Chitinophagaceae bacterium]